MAELRESLLALAERPPATPVAVEIVAARASRFARRRRAAYGAATLAIGMVAALAVLGVATQDSESGMVMATQGATTAGYIAEQPGGYVATGTWRISITRDGQVIELSSTTSDHCGPIGIIQPGDEVRGSIGGPPSSLRVGERYTCPE